MARVTGGLGEPFARGAGTGTAPVASIADVAIWLAEASPLLAFSGVSTTWTMRPDEDGALLVMPSGDETPGFAIIPGPGGTLEVIVAHPERAIELGPFATLVDALRGVATWLTPAGGRA